MPLDVSKLTSGLLSAWSAYPPTTQIAATQWANAYNTYAMDAMACSASPPTLVMLADLISGIKDAIDAGGDYGDVADAISAAHEAFWTGALFGATGSVVAITGTSALKSGLETLWETQSITMTPFPASAAQHAPLFDTFTKTVMVLDTAVPPPTGCGPAPIS
jgi:hypothetical protein